MSHRFSIYFDFPKVVAANNVTYRMAGTVKRLISLVARVVEWQTRQT